jgi:hypothetical protein
MPAKRGHLLFTFIVSHIITRASKIQRDEINVAING